MPTPVEVLALFDGRKWRTLPPGSVPPERTVRVTRLPQNCAVMPHPICRLVTVEMRLRPKVTLSEVADLRRRFGH